MDKKKQPEWHPEGFPEPRTFPDGWNGHALRFTKGHHPHEEMEVPRDSDESDTDWIPEKFPKPRTFPKNWSIED